MQRNNVSLKPVIAIIVIAAVVQAYFINQYFKGELTFERVHIIPACVLLFLIGIAIIVKAVGFKESAPLLFLSRVIFPASFFMVLAFLLLVYILIPDIPAAFLIIAAVAELAGSIAISRVLRARMAKSNPKANGYDSFDP